MEDAVRSIERWSRHHAVLLLIGLVNYWFLRSLWIVPLISFISFSWLVISHRGMLIQGDRLSRANMVTLLRHDGMLLLTVCSRLIPVFWIGIFASVLALLDILDGYYARKDQNASIIGQYLDKETDALFILLLGIMIFDQSLTSWWILLFGLMRYLYVLMLPLIKKPNVREYKSKFGRVIAVVLVVSLIGCFFLRFPAYRYLLFLVLGLTFFSFARSTIYWITSSDENEG